MDAIKSFADFFDLWGHIMKYGVATVSCAYLEAVGGSYWMRPLQEEWSSAVQHARRQGVAAKEHGHEDRLFAWQPLMAPEYTSFVWMDLGRPGPDAGDWKQLNRFAPIDPSATTSA